MAGMHHHAQLFPTSWGLELYSPNLSLH
jgi:hypothetical protein